MERDLGTWNQIYRNTRKSEQLKFEANEWDEGKLERIGQTVTIYEIYSGPGAWPFMHHGSLYRGLSLVRSIYSLFYRHFPFTSTCFCFLSQLRKNRFHSSIFLELLLTVLFLSPNSVGNSCWNLFHLV